MSWRARVLEVLGEAEREPFAPPPAPPPPPVTPPLPPSVAERLKTLEALSAPPNGLSEGGWARVLRAARARGEKWGAAALALGWTVDDLLQVDPDHWFRLDRRGAFLLHEAGQVVGVTAACVAIRAGHGDLRFRRPLQASKSPAPEAA